jgi:hypothetical protein
LQQLIWQIAGGLSYSQLPPQSQRLVDQLIPEFKSRINEDFVETLSKNAHRGDALCKYLPGVCKASTEVDALIQRYQQTRQVLLQDANNYEAMARQFVNIIPGMAENAGPASWSQLNKRVYARLTGGKYYGEVGTLEIRVLPAEGSRLSLHSDASPLQAVSFRASVSSDPTPAAENETAEVPLQGILGYPNDMTKQGLSWALESTSGNSGPVITAVSPILPQANQTITITGTGFGSMKPYDGDSPYIEIGDLTRNWYAGHSGNWVTLNVQSWTDTQIVVGGFTGQYGMAGTTWTLQAGDHAQLRVWSPESGAGPGTFERTVLTQSSEVASQARLVLQLELLNMQLEQTETDLMWIDCAPSSVNQAVAEFVQAVADPTTGQMAQTGEFVFEVAAALKDSDPIIMADTVLVPALMQEAGFDCDKYNAARAIVQAAQDYAASHVFTPSKPGPLTSHSIIPGSIHYAPALITFKMSPAFGAQGTPADVRLRFLPCALDLRCSSSARIASSISANPAAGTPKPVAESRKSAQNANSQPRVRQSEAGTKGVRSVDFRNFSYSSDCSEKLDDGFPKTIPVANGEWKKQKNDATTIGFRVAKMVQGQLKPNGPVETAVATSCYAAANFDYEELFVIDTSAGAAKLLAKLTPSDWGKGQNCSGPNCPILELSIVNKQLAVGFGTGGSHACPATLVTTRFQWSGSGFVQVGQEGKPYVCER